MEVCELLADEEITIDPNCAKYRCEKAEATLPRHPITFRLRERLVTMSNTNLQYLETDLQGFQKTLAEDFMDQINNWFEEIFMVQNQILRIIESNNQNTREQFKLLKISFEQFKEDIEFKDAVVNAREGKLDTKEGQKELKESESDVFLCETDTIEDDQNKAAELLLPKDFYTYKTKEPCEGCHGCDKDNEAPPVSTPIRSFSSAFSSPTTSNYGTPLNDNTASSIFRTPLSNSMLTEKWKNLSFAALSSGGPGFNIQSTSQQLFGGAQLAADRSANENGAGDESTAGANEEDDPHYKPIVPLPDKITVTTRKEDEKLQAAFVEEKETKRNADADDDQGDYNEEDDELSAFYVSDVAAVFRQGSSLVVHADACVQLTFDQEASTPRIMISRNDTEELVASMLIHSDTHFQIHGDACTWTGLDCTSHEPVDKTVILFFLNSDDAMLFYDSCLVCSQFRISTPLVVTVLRPHGSKGSHSSQYYDLIK